MVTEIIEEVKQNKKIVFILSLFIFLFLGCNKNDVFFQYQSIPNFIWSKDFSTNINYEINDTIKKYNSYIHIRHNSEYPYQNLWLFLEEKLDSITISRDTLEIVIADKYGKWLGSGVGGIREVSVPYEYEISFPKLSHYELLITHLMDTDNLKGIEKIGLRIEKVE